MSLEDIRQRLAEGDWNVMDRETKERIQPILLDFIREMPKAAEWPKDKRELDAALTRFELGLPQEAEDLASDFARTMLARGWHEEVFEAVWKYISLIRLRNSEKCDVTMKTYLKGAIELQKREAQMMIMDLVRPKQSQAA